MVNHLHLPNAIYFEIDSESKKEHTTPIRDPLSENAMEEKDNNMGDVRLANKSVDEHGLPRAFLEDCDITNDAVIKFDPADGLRDNGDLYLNLDNKSVIRPSSSIEAINLNSWPTTSSETTPEQHKDKLGTQRMEKLIVLLSLEISFKIDFLVFHYSFY